MDKSVKKFIPSIYLKNGRATRSLSSFSVLSEDPVALAISYCESGADGLLIFDQSIKDDEHETSLGIIREICQSASCPIIGAGHIRRMEDVKKLLYAGCSMAALNYARKDNIELTKEVSEKFGRERIAVCYRAADSLTLYKDLIIQYVDELILIDETKIRKALEIKEIPSILCLPEISLDKVIEFLSLDNVCGITGNAVSDNVTSLRTLKRLCAENGINVMLGSAKYSWNDFRKNNDGLLPVVTQEDSTGEVLMVAYMNEEAYNMTVETGRMTYYSRSRQELWVKGLTSGHFQYVRSLTADCDMDTLLARVDQVGAACHTGSHSCFFNTDLIIDTEKKNNPQKVLSDVYNVIADRRAHPKEGSYTNYLFEKGIDKMLKKLGEESTEIVIAAKNTDNREVVYEIADYLYHLMVLMAQKNISWADVTDELARREQKK